MSQPSFLFCGLYCLNNTCQFDQSLHSSQKLDPIAFLFCFFFSFRSAEKPIQLSTGSKSDHEDDLDYDGALAKFIQSTQRVFSESSSDENGFDVVDAPKDEVDADSEATTSQSQATYIVINSHDVLQLTVTPTAVAILTELSQVIFRWLRVKEIGNCRSRWVGACNSTIFLSRRFHGPISLEWDFRGNATTNHKKLIDVTALLDRNCLSFTKEKVY